MDRIRTGFCRLIWNAYAPSAGRILCLPSSDVRRAGQRAPVPLHFSFHLLELRGGQSVRRGIRGFRPVPVQIDPYDQREVIRPDIGSRRKSTTATSLVT